MAVYKREYKSRGRPVWYYQFHHGGVKYAKAGFAAKKDANDAERRRREELKSKRNRPVPKPDVTLEQLMPKFLDFRNMDRHDQAAKREVRRSRPIVAFLGRSRMRDLASSDIHDYVMRRKREDGIQNRTMNLELSFLRRLFDYAVDNGYADQNPAKSVKNLKQKRPKRPDFFKEHFLLFARAAETAPTASV